MRFLRHENSNLKKNALNKIKSLCHSDSKHIFKSNIVLVLSETNVFKLDAEFEIFKSAARFSVYFKLYALFTTWKRKIKEKRLK
jgi:predicted ABC-type exoprotein transport system permease subunit